MDPASADLDPARPRATARPIGAETARTHPQPEQARPEQAKPEQAEPERAEHRADLAGSDGEVDLERVVAAWVADEDLEGELVHLERIPGRRAIHEDLEPPLPGLLAARLADRGVERLYRHQARAVRAIREGRHTVIVSGTSSGKTLCYQIPIAEAVLEDRRATSLLLFPTKALAQDQLRSLRELRIPGLSAATYDGDTPSDERARVRREANVILTNPDMLHVGILPNHGRWADLFLRLRYVVIDEMHVFRGMFGSHVAHILRRLRRIAAHYGSDPTFVFASATIGNPEDLARRLSGLPVELAAGDDSPSGDKLVALWNPPLTEPEAGRRRSPLSETTDLFVDLVRRHLHTIVFSRSRKATELVFRWAAERLGPELADRIAPYRAGYLPQERRRIERRLFSGELLGVAATNALELGIDVGSLDAAIVNTFPGTLASFWQQAGRAGRSRRSALVTLVGGEDALDQYFMSHPSELFSRAPEPAVINPDNELVVEAHTACAAYELPLEPGDADYLGPTMEEAATRLAAAGHLRLRDGRLFWARRRRPAPEIDIRSAGGPTYHVVDAGRRTLLGTLEESRAFRDAHEGAVYLHQGDTYVVERLDMDRKEVLVTRRDVDWYTQTRTETAMEVIAVDAEGRLGRLGHHLGRVRVEHHVTGFQRKRIGTGEVLSREDLDLPPTVFETQAFWLTVPDGLQDAAGIDHLEWLGTLHAAEHAGIGMLPLFAICDRWDIGGLSTDWHPATGKATIFIYDGYPGGAGIAPIAYERGGAHLAATLEMLEACPCEAGCPSCVQSPKCGNLNEPLSKHGAIAFLRTALDGR